jgi:FixJ family two-component response regulator
MSRTAVISIVDDDLSVREGAKDLLDSLGFATETFQCADDFLNSGRLSTTSCLVADVQMPGMTGLALYDHLVASGKVVPTILITAFPVDQDRTRALRAGVVCYLTKPFNDNELLACIHTALDRRNPNKGNA